MPAPSPPTRRGHTSPALIGAAGLVFVCCVGSVLIAAGALGALGAYLTSPYLLAAAAALVLVAVVAWARRRSRRSTGRHPGRDEAGHPQRPALERRRGTP